MKTRAMTAATAGVPTRRGFVVSLRRNAIYRRRHCNSSARLRRSEAVNKT
jgi:hypothetical protein